MGIIYKTGLCLLLVVVLAGGLSCSSPAATSEDQTWLIPGKIQVKNTSLGDRIEQYITIHNGNNDNTAFSIYYRTPDYVENNFVTAPDVAREWLEISEESPVLAPKETKEIRVILDLPGDIQIPEKWEFWIGVKQGRESMLTAELCSRWLITMK
jgi:hypothetical protein